MATNRSTTPKSKAKTARRTTTPAKRKAPVCPVAEIAERQVKLIRAREHIDAKIEAATDAESKQGIKAEIRDAMLSNRDAASYLTPKSAIGAWFLLLSVYQDAVNMRDTDDRWPRQREFRRLERSAYRLQAFLERSAPFALERSMLRIFYMKSWFDPQLRVNVAVEQAEKEEAGEESC